jgi:hypothetical protein
MAAHTQAGRSGTFTARSEDKNWSHYLLPTFTEVCTKCICLLPYGFDKILFIVRYYYERPRLLIWRHGTLSP